MTLCARTPLKLGCPPRRNGVYPRSRSKAGPVRIYLHSCDVTEANRGGSLRVWIDFVPFRALREVLDETLNSLRWHRTSEHFQ